MHNSNLELLTLNHGLLCTLFILRDGILLEQANQRDLTCSRFQGVKPVSSPVKHIKPNEVGFRSPPPYFFLHWRWILVATGSKLRPNPRYIHRSPVAPRDGSGNTLNW